MPDDVDEYYIKVVLPCKGFNLWHYMSSDSPMGWDFDKIREELAQLESVVQAARQDAA